MQCPPLKTNLEYNLQPIGQLALQLCALHLRIGIPNAQILQLSQAMYLMPQLVLEHNLIVDGLQFVQAASFQVTHSLGQQRFRNEVLGLR